MHPEDVATSRGMGRGTVYGWLAKFREGGRDALKARPVPRRPPKLTSEQSGAIAKKKMKIAIAAATAPISGRVSMREASDRLTGAGVSDAFVGRIAGVVDGELMGAPG